jgi:hypothetical protein
LVVVRAVRLNVTEPTQVAVPSVDVPVRTIV